MIIGAVGKNATGKDYLLEYIANKYDLPMVSVGDIARELAAKEGIEPTRENLHLISQKYMGQYGQTFFPEQISKKIEQLGVKNILISGIRPLSDAEFFKERYGKDFLLLCVKVSDDQIRFNRMRARNSKRDPLTFEDLVKQDEAEEKIFQTSESEKRADIIVYNDSDMDTFNNEIDKLFHEKIKPLL